MAGFIDGIISLSIGVILLATVFISTVKNQNTTDFTATELTLWGLLTLMGIIGLLYGVMRVFGVGM